LIVFTIKVWWFLFSPEKIFWFSWRLTLEIIIDHSIK
jgi:hypothetical protein